MVSTTSFPVPSVNGGSVIGTLVSRLSGGLTVGECAKQPESITVRRHAHVAVNRSFNFTDDSPVDDAFTGFQALQLIFNGADNLAHIVADLVGQGLLSLYSDEVFAVLKPSPGQPAACADSGHDCSNEGGLYVGDHLRHSTTALPP